MSEFIGFVEVSVKNLDAFLVKNNISLEKHQLECIAEVKADADKFVIDGVSTADTRAYFNKYDDGYIHYHHALPIVIVDGFEMVLSKVYNAKTFEFYPLDRSWRYQGEPDFKEPKPNKVGAPTAKKLRAWADYLKRKTEYVTNYRNDAEKKKSEFLQMLRGKGFEPQELRDNKYVIKTKYVNLNIQFYNDGSEWHEMSMKLDTSRNLAVFFKLANIE